MGKPSQGCTLTSVDSFNGLSKLFPEVDELEAAVLHR